MSEKSDKEFVAAIAEFRKEDKGTIIGKLILSEQREAALMVQNNELIKAINAYAGTGRDEQWQVVKSTISAQPERSLSAQNKRIRDEAIDDCKAIILEEPEYISSSQEHRRGYAKAVNMMKLRIDEL